MRRRLDLRLRGIGDPADVDAGLVDMLHEQVRAVVHPPVAPVPVELLGRDEVGEPPAVVLALGLAPRRCPAGRQVGDLDPPTAHEGDACPIGADPRIDGRAGTVELGGPAVGDVDDVRDPRDDECGPRPRPVDAECGDARGHLAHPLAARPLLGGQIALREQRRGIDDEPFGPRGILGPQVADRIAPARAADEQHEVAGDREPARAPALEPAGPRLLPRERVGHDGIVPHGRPRDSVGG